MIPFAEWLPDLPDYKNPGATVAKNVVPLAMSYGQVRSKSAVSSALGAYARGGIGVRDSAGDSYLYVGTGVGLYQLNASNAWDDVTNTGGAYTTASDGGWEFAKWGEKIIATNFADNPQIITIGGANFADLSGSPPKARHVAVVGNFVVLGNTYDAVDFNVPNRVRWSAIEDEAGWTTGTSQSDYQDLLGGGGWVQRIIGGEYGLVFQERSIWRMTYVGTPTVFQFDNIEPELGTRAAGSVIQYGRRVFYLGQDGFYMLMDGTQSMPISANKVSQWFFDDLDSTYEYRISAAVDPEQTLVYWSYPGTGNTAGTPNKLIVYNWTTQRWSYVEIETETLVQMQSYGYTLEDLDAFGDLDTLPFSLDSRVWNGGSFALGLFSTDHKLAYMAGTALSAVIETGEVQFFPGRKSLLCCARPIVEGSSATATVQIGTRDTLSGSVSWTSAASLSADGKASVRAGARYHRIRCNISGGFDHAQGVEFDAKQAGRR